MKASRYIDRKNVVSRGLRALNRELGPVETSRFIAMAGQPREDSVTRHRAWQDTLKPEAFIRRVMDSYRT